jgi:outer membrane protein assembly factor BamB
LQATILSGNAFNNRSLIVSEAGLYVIDRDTFAIRWRELFEQQTFTPVIGGDRIYVSSSKGLFALDANSGEVIWRYPSTQGGLTPVLQNRHLYLANRNGALQSFDTSTGTLLWERRFAGWIYPPAYCDDLLLTGGSEGVLWGVDASDGQIRWSFPLGQELVYSPLIFANELIIATTFNREVFALDPAGELVWRQGYETIMTESLVLGELLIFYGLDHQIHAVNAYHGDEVWQRHLPEALAVRMRHDQGYLLLALESGQVWVVEPVSGELASVYQLPGEPIASPQLFNNGILGFIRTLDGPMPVLLGSAESSISFQND